MGQDTAISSLQFSYVAETSSFDKASKKIEKQLIEQEKLLQKSEKSFLSLNKVLLASGVGLSVLAVKKMPQLKAALSATGKTGLGLVNSLEKIFLATQGVFGPFTKVAAALSGMTIGFDVASLSMSAMGLSTAGAFAKISEFAGLLSGGALLALGGFISAVQGVSDSIANSLIGRLEESISVGARLETQTFALGLSLNNYRKATGDAGVTTKSMISLLDDLGRTTGLTRGQLKGGLTQMLNLSRATGLTADQIKVLIERAADMSVALGVDFNEAVIAIDQSFKGYNAQLLNFGVNITEGSLAATKFVQTQDRSVDSLSASQLALAKYEDILNQTTTSVGALSKANLTIKGSALNAELAIESFSNRLGEASQKIFGPAIVKINNLRASMFDLAGNGGAAKLSASVTAVGAVFFKSVALILKWGTALVFAKEGFSLLGFFLRNAGKGVGLFNGLLRFLATVTQAAATGMSNLSKTTGKYAFAAKAASKAAVGLNFAASGLNSVAGASEKAAKKAGASMSGLAFSSGVLFEVLKGLSKVLFGFAKQLGRWSLIGAAITVTFLVLVGVMKSLTKTVLGFFGLNVSSVFEAIRKKVDAFAESVKDMALFLVGLPERISLSFEFITNSITLAVVSGLSQIDIFASGLSGTLARLKEENIALGKEILALDKKDSPVKTQGSTREFKDSRGLIRARKEAELARLDLFNSQEAVIQRISFIQTKITQNEQDTLAVVKPQIALQEKLVKLQEEKNALISGVGTAPKSLSDKSERASTKRAEKLASIKERIGVLEADIEKSTLVNDRSEEERNTLLVERIALEGALAAESRKEKDLAGLVAKSNKESVLFLGLQNEAVRLQNVNRFESLKVESELLGLREEGVRKALAARKAEAGGTLGVIEQIPFLKRLLALGQDRLDLLAQEKALRRSLLDELGPLNTQFQEARSKELQQRVAELREAGATSIELARVQSLAEQQNQRDIWGAIIAQSDDAGQILRAKTALFFEDARTTAQKTADVMFSVFQTMDGAISATLSNIATGVTSLGQGFKDFSRAVVSQVIQTFVDLGIQQTKTFLLQESGVQNALSGLRSEAVGVASLTTQYDQLATAKLGASGFTGASIPRLSSTLQAPPLPGGLSNSGGIPGLQGGAPLVSGQLQGQVGPRLPNGAFVSGTGGAASSRLSGSLGAAGLGSIGGGLLGSAIGGPEGGQAGAIGGGIGAGIGFAFGGPAGGFIGGAIGSIAGGLFGRSKKGKRKRQERELKSAIKFLKDLSDDLETETINIELAIRRVAEKIGKSSGPARAELEKFAKELAKNANLLKKNLLELKDSLATEIGLLQLDFKGRGTASEIEALRDRVKGLRKEFLKMPSAFPGFEALLTQFTDDSLAEMLRQVDKTVADVGKSFNEGARKDSGELISITARSVLDIAKLNKSLIKLEKDRAKAVKDIQDEGVAQRQKTIKKDKAERIKKLEEQFAEEKLNLENQKSTITIVAEERRIQFEKDKATAEANRVIVQESITASDDKKKENAAAFAQANADVSRITSEITKSKADSIAADNAIRQARRNGSREDVRRARVEFQRLEDLIESLKGDLESARGRVDQFNPTASTEVPTTSNVDIVTNPDGSISVTIGSQTKGSFAKGGQIKETGPALVHEGEFVLKKSVAQPLLPLLEALNGNRIPAVRNPSASGGVSSAAPDMSINIRVGNVDSPDRVKEIESVVRRLQRVQLNNVRQMIQV